MSGDLTGLCLYIYHLPQMSRMITPIKNQGMVDVPGRGLVVYGSQNSTFPYSQKLANLHGYWTTGPTFYQSPLEYGFGQCIVQVFLFMLKT